MRPLIGLPAPNHASEAGQRVFRGYCEAVAAGSGAPERVPLLHDEQALRALYARLDGLCLMGGGDVAPERYAATYPERVLNIDRERDWVEDLLCRWALEDDKPLLAICRGAQMLNVAGGGTLYEDIDTLIHGALPHATPQGLPRDLIAHTVDVEPDSRLAHLLGVQDAGAHGVPVNSRHHQALRDVATGLRVTARATDGVIEAVEAGEGGRTRIVGVQWHPENLWRGHATMVRLFARFCALCEDGQ